MTRLKSFLTSIRWLYRPIVVTGILGILGYIVTFGPIIVKALNERTFDSVEQKIRFTDHLEGVPSDVEVYKQAIRQDSIAIEFLLIRDSLIKKMEKMDTLSNRNAITIYQMKNDQKKFFEKVLERLIRN